MKTSKYLGTCSGFCYTAHHRLLHPPYLETLVSLLGVLSFAGFATSGFTVLTHMVQIPICTCLPLFLYSQGFVLSRSLRVQAGSWAEGPNGNLAGPDGHPRSQSRAGGRPSPRGG
uniref:Uncharacterized protein n=1 Tax=Sphaerodactylus townsendi TaxID=933632 RepID=A0ACB8E965_9SAUR